jgi:NADPH:quinone reductase-like Zn-dependent oxidoreductase
MNGLTVRLALDLLALKPGQTLAVSGAAGAVGAYAVELGVAEGLRVIAIASPGDEAMLKKMGAEHFVPRGDDAPHAIRKLVSEGVDGAVDAALLGTAFFSAIKDGGGMAVVRGWQQGEPERGIKIHPVMVSNYVENQAALAKLGKQVEEGKITLRVAETFPPERAGEAQEKLAAGGVRGRLVIVF